MQWWNNMNFCAIEMVFRQAAFFLFFLLFFFSTKVNFGCSPREMREREREREREMRHKLHLQLKEKSNLRRRWKRREKGPNIAPCCFHKHDTKTNAINFSRAQRNRVCFGQKRLKFYNVYSICTRLEVLTLSPQKKFSVSPMGSLFKPREQSLARTM